MRQLSGLTKVMFGVVGVLLVLTLVLAVATAVSDNKKAKNTDTKNNTSQTEQGVNVDDKKPTEEPSPTPTTAPTDTPVPTPSPTPAFTIAIDPGKQAGGGSKSVNSLSNEVELNLEVAVMLKEKLESYGFAVHLTRDNNDDNTSNTDRALLSVQAGADIIISLQTDSVGYESAHGIYVQTPGSGYEKYNESNILANLMQPKLIHATEAYDRGIQEAKEAGKLPIIEKTLLPGVIVRMGYMSNPEEDALLHTVEYQSKITDAICDAIIIYFNNAE